MALPKASSNDKLCSENFYVICGGVLIALNEEPLDNAGK